MALTAFSRSSSYTIMEPLSEPVMKASDSGYLSFRTMTGSLPAAFRKRRSPRELPSASPSGWVCVTMAIPEAPEMQSIMETIREVSISAINSVSCRLVRPRRDSDIQVGANLQIILHLINQIFNFVRNLIFKERLDRI